MASWYCEAACWSPTQRYHRRSSPGGGPSLEMPYVLGSRENSELATLGHVDCVRREQSCGRTSMVFSAPFFYPGMTIVSSVSELAAALTLE